MTVAGLEIPTCVTSQGGARCGERQPEKKVSLPWSGCARAGVTGGRLARSKCNCAEKCGGDGGRGEGKASELLDLGI